VDKGHTSWRGEQERDQGQSHGWSSKAKSEYERHQGQGQQGQCEQGKCKTISPDLDINVVELSNIHIGLIMEGNCFIKETVLLLLVGSGKETLSDAAHVLKQWHDQVTKKNLKLLSELAEGLKMPLPFMEPIEERESSIKRALGNIGSPVVKDCEALMELRIGGSHLCHFYTQATMTAHDPHIRSIFKEIADNVFHGVCQVKNALEKTAHVPLPIVKKFSVADFGVTSHTGKSQEFQGRGQREEYYERENPRGQRFEESSRRGVDESAHRLSSD